MRVVLTSYSNASTNLTYCMLNNGIQHLLRAHLSMCWEEVTGEMDLHTFADKKLTWEEIKDFAQKILDQHIGEEAFGYSQELPKAEHNLKHKNQMLFNQDAVLYVLLAMASNTGAMGSDERPAMALGAHVFSLQKT